MSETLTTLDIRGYISTDLPGLLEQELVKLNEYPHVIIVNPAQYNDLAAVARPDGPFTGFDGKLKVWGIEIHRREFLRHSKTAKEL